MILPKIEVDDNDNRKPFKLCFGKKHPIGRSNIQIGKPLSISTNIRIKFTNVFQDIYF